MRAESLTQLSVGSLNGSLESSAPDELTLSLSMDDIDSLGVVW